MTEPDDALRGVLRDLIPDYTGPVDPLPRVVATVRRRRMRQRTLIAVSSVGAAVVVAVGAPALLVAGPAGGQAAAPGGPAGPVPAASGSPARPSLPPVHPVAAGRIGTARWAVGSVSYEVGSQRCLTSDDDLFHADTACFESWKAGSPVTWTAQQVPDPGVTRVVGVAPGGAATVLVRFTDGQSVTAAAVRTPTDPTGRFFGLVVTGDRTVRDVTAVSGTGAPIGPPVTDPGAPPCVPGPTIACVPGK